MILFLPKLPNLGADPSGINGENFQYSCLVLTVTLVLHFGPQPGDALLAAPLPQQHVLSILSEVNLELART